MPMGSSAEGFVVLLSCDGVGASRDLVRFCGRQKRTIFFWLPPVFARRKKCTGWLRPLDAPSHTFRLGGRSDSGKNISIAAVVFRVRVMSHGYALSFEHGILGVDHLIGVVVRIDTRRNDGRVHQFCSLMPQYVHSHA